MDISNLTIEEKVGQMLVFAFHGTEFNHQIETFIEEFNIGGIIYFFRNIKNVKQVASLNEKVQSVAKIPLFIGLDQEGGPVLRIMEGITPLPGAMAMSAAGGRDIYRITKAVGNDLLHLGFNMNFAPVADVNNNPFNPVINSRSYSDQPEVVARLALQAAKGFQDAKILPTIKHFPGHGDTNVDSHLGLPIVDKTKADLEEVELIPFKHIINNGIDGVMVSHILYPAYDKIYPATLSYNIITKLLREELGFNGIVCTDSLTMQAISNSYRLEEIVELAVNAGNDLLIFCGRADLTEQRRIYQSFVSAVKTGRISESRVDESVRRILTYKKKYGETNIDLTKLANKEDVQLANKIQANSLTLVKEENVIPLSAEDNVLILFPKLNVFSLVDNEGENYKSLGCYLPFDEIIVDYDQENIENIASKAKKYDIIIYGTYNVTKGDKQQQLFNLLDKSKTIVVSLRSPYDFLYLQLAKNYICTYEVTAQSLYYLSLSLLGDNPFVGQLPINLED